MVSSVSADKNSSVVAPIIVHARIMCSRHEETLPMSPGYNQVACSAGFSATYGSTENVVLSGQHSICRGEKALEISCYQFLFTKR